ncbi:MAG: hypothetical protein AVW05_03545 [Hadesarchaea archaeon DG-33]|nr:MAG: hypothetical protein AVW05_03545 [Hadesarchaea archaeon DG-33]
MKESRRKKPTPLGWVTIAIILAVFIFGVFLWIVPHVREDPAGTIIRTFILLITLAVVIGVARALGGKSLFRE